MVYSVQASALYVKRSSMMQLAMDMNSTEPMHVRT